MYCVYAYGKDVFKFVSMHSAITEALDSRDRLVQQSQDPDLYYGVWTEESAKRLESAINGRSNV